MCGAGAGGKESEVGVAAGGVGQTLRLQEVSGGAGGRARSQGRAGMGLEQLTGPLASGESSTGTDFGRGAGTAGAGTDSPGLGTEQIAGRSHTRHPEPSGTCVQTGAVPSGGWGGGDKGPDGQDRPARCSHLPPPGGQWLKDTQPRSQESAWGALLPGDTGQQLKSQGLRGERAQT